MSQQFENKDDKRRSRRRQIPASAQVVQWDSPNAVPEIAKLVDVSSDGILFETDREYRVGMKLFVRFPLPTSPKQAGTVVRVEELPDGHRRVAVRLE